jgi:hypothetical protein
MYKDYLSIVCFANKKVTNTYPCENKNLLRMLFSLNYLQFRQNLNSDLLDLSWKWQKQKVSEQKAVSGLAKNLEYWPPYYQNKFQMWYN